MNNSDVLGLRNLLSSGLLARGGASSIPAPGLERGWGDRRQHLGSWPLLAHPFSALKLPKFMPSENGPTRASEGASRGQQQGGGGAGRGAAQGSAPALLPVGEGLDAFPSRQAVQTFPHRLRLPAHLAYVTTCLSHWPLSSTWAGIPAQPCSLDWVLHHRGGGGGGGQGAGPETRTHPPITEHALPHFAADSGLKQSRSSPFPPCGSSSLTCGCLLWHCR